MPLGVKPLSGLSRPPLSGEAEDGLKVVDSGEAVPQDDDGHPEGAVVGAVERRVVLSRMEDGEGGLDFGAGLFDFGVGHSIYHNTQTAPRVQKKVELFWDAIRTTRPHRHAMDCHGTRATKGPLSGLCSLRAWAEESAFGVSATVADRTDRQTSQ